MATPIRHRPMFSPSGERQMVKTLEEKEQLEAQGWKKTKPQQAN